MFRSAAHMFQRIGITNEHFSLALGSLLVLALFATVAWLLVVQFGSEISAMLADLPGTLAAIERNLGSSAVGAAIVDAVQAATGGGAIANRLGDILLGSGRLLVNFLIVLVGAIFIAADPRPYRRAVVLLTPPPGRQAMERALDQVTAALKLWLKAKLLTMAIMTVLISASLWWAGLESWAALGLLGGLSEFVPYVGPAVAMLPSIGLAAAAGGSVFWRTVAGYVVARLFEAYLMTPLVNRRVVRIPPALTLFVILGVGAVFGIYGVFFAGALLVVAYVGIRELYLRDTLGEDLSGVTNEEG
jgi:predicted PurR-regulated permease PerM